MENSDLLKLHKILDQLAAKSPDDESENLAEAHSIISKLSSGDHFCGPWQSGNDPDTEECVICGAHRVVPSNSPVMHNFWDRQYGG